MRGGADVPVLFSRIVPAVGGKSPMTRPSNASGSTNNASFTAMPCRGRSRAQGGWFTELRAVRRQPRAALIRLDAQERQTAVAVRPDDAVYGDHRQLARYRSRWRACGSRADRIASR